MHFVWLGLASACALSEGLSTMLPIARDDQLSTLQRKSAVATSIPLGEIIGLAVGGPAFFAFLVLLIVVYLRRRHRREKAKFKEIDDGELSNENRQHMRSIGTQFCALEEHSLHPALRPKHLSATPSNEWLHDESMMDSPPTIRAHVRKLSRKRLFRISGLRNSWPLAASMPTMSQVGGGGYVIPPEPKWPKRTCSRKSQANILPSEISNMYRLSTDSKDILVKPLPARYDRHSVSENQLSTILRSTSQRLKMAHQKSLSRKLTNVNRSSGPPPLDRLETPPKAVTGVRNRLSQFAPDDVEYVASSIYDTYLNQTPSPTKQEAKGAGQSTLRRRLSLTPSVESFDSLCVGTTSDLMVPVALSSPSKRISRSVQQPELRLSSVSAKDLFTTRQDQCEVSALELKNQGLGENKAASASPHRNSLARDPVYSVVQVGKRAMPQNKIIGPRPYYIRQTTFGQEATAERPSSFVSNSSSSPLHNISGNSQMPHRPDSVGSAPSDPISNPFAWKPQVTIKMRPPQSPSNTGSRKKGHKRSNVVSISFPSRPLSVCPVPEDPDEDSSPLRFNIPPNAPKRVFEPAKTPSPRRPSTSGLRLASRPPSASSFNPALSISRIAEVDRKYLHGSRSHPDLSTQIYSPTLATSNYYTEGRTSEDDFFNPKTTQSKPSSPSQSQQQQIFNMTQAFPHPEHKELFSFPPLKLDVSADAGTSRRQSDATTTPTTVLSPVQPALLNSPQCLPGQPILTQYSSTPPHLNGPRSEPPKRMTVRDSMLQQSICMLRRMNSEVSRCSTISNDDEEGRDLSWSPVKMSPDGRNWGRRFDRRSHGTKAYLTMGMGGESRRRSKIGSQRSSKSEKIAQTHMIEEKEEEDDSTTEPQRAGLAKGDAGTFFRPADQVKSEEGVEQTLKFPTTTSVGATDRLENQTTTIKDSTPTKSEKSESPSAAGAAAGNRWSDATPSPSIRVNRRESQLLQPSPKISLSWEWKKLNDDKDEVNGAEEMKENVFDESPVKKGNAQWNSNFDKYNSLGLYDSDGFLLSTPVKERFPDA